MTRGHGSGWLAMVRASTARRVLAPMFAAMLIWSLYGLWQLDHTLRSAVRDPAELRARAYLTSVVTAAEAIPDEVKLREIVGRLALGANLEQLVILGLPERVVVASGRPDDLGQPIARLGDPRLIADLRGFLESADQRPGVRTEGETVVALAPIQLPWRNSGLRGMPGEAVVYLRASIAEELGLVRDAVFSLSLQRILFSSAAILLAAWLIHRFVHRPAGRLREAVQAFAAGDADARVSGVHHAEFALLADAVNQAFSTTREAQDRLRALTEAAPTGIFSLDHRGGCLSTNERWREMTGLSADEALGHGWLRAIHPEDREAMRAAWDSPATTRNAAPLYHRLQRPDGTERWVLRTLTPLRDHAGSVTGFIGNLADITELRVLQDRLRSSEQQQRLLFESMPQGVIIYDHSGRVIEANPAAERFLGYSREELVRGEHRAAVAQGPFREDGTFVPIEERPSHVALRERREVRDVVLGLVSRQGGRLGWYRINAIPLFAGRNGAEARVYFTMEDITGIRAAQEALRRSESRYQDLVETSPDLIFETDLRGALTYVNRTWQQITGHGPDRLIGRPWWHLEPVPAGGARPAGEAAFGRLLADREISGVELEWQSAVGARISVVVNARVVAGPQGEPAGFRGTAHDVTQRKATLALLAESQERFASFFDQAVDAMVVSNDQGIILEVNPAACRLLGRTREELIGRGRDVIIDLSDPRAAEAVARRSRDGLFHGELFSRRADGERLEVEVTSQFYRARDGRQQAGTILRDISARKREEAIRLRSQRLESIGTLAGGIAHDLNNALAPITLGITLLQRRFPERADILGTLQGSASRAAGMVRQLLTFARGADGERKPVDSDRLLGEVVALTARTFPRATTVTCEAAPDLPEVLGDETQLHQVALNLCVNARDAMPAGGTLRITARRETVSAAESSPLGDLRPGPHVVWRFTDTGSGINPAVLERIFDPFFTTKPAGEGTGLGLPTALGIVRSHGGAIRVESQPGRGSTFTVILPAAGREAAAPAPATSSPAQASTVDWAGRGQVVLLVEDEAAVREIAADVLRNLGLEVRTAADGEEAVRDLSSGVPPAVVLTDFQMPGLDGLGLARWIRENRTGLPVIVASGRLDEAGIAQLRAQGVAHFLPKPFEEGRLVEILRRVLTD